jgi:hypothetical protein
MYSCTVLLLFVTCLNDPPFVLDSLAVMSVMRCSACVQTSHEFSCED